MAAVLAACGRPPLALAPPPQGAEAVSLLGDTLWSAPIPPGEGAGRVARLADARRRSLGRPDDLPAAILLGKRTADLGRFREAIGIYTRRPCVGTAPPADRRWHRCPAAWAAIQPPPVRRRIGSSEPSRNQPPSESRKYFDINV